MVGGVGLPGSILIHTHPRSSSPFGYSVDGVHARFHFRKTVGVVHPSAKAALGSARSDSKNDNWDRNLIRRLRIPSYMYDVEETDYGLRLTVAGNLDPDEAEEYANTVQSNVRDISGSFGILADLREMKTIPQDLTDDISELMKFCSDQGMHRSVSVVDTAVNSMQMERLSESAGIKERIINARDNLTWEEDAVRWLDDGVEP